MTSTSPYHRCSACGGSGEWRGILPGHEGPCAPCGGSGLVQASGEPLTAEQLAQVVRVARGLVRTRNEQLRRLQAELDKLRPPRTPEDITRDAVYPPGSRYHGD